MLKMTVYTKAVTITGAQRTTHFVTSLAKLFFNKIKKQVIQGTQATRTHTTYTKRTSSQDSKLIMKVSERGKR